MNNTEIDIEQISEVVHKAYCEERTRQGKEPYWTHGDYSKLDEATKDYDRATVRAVLKALALLPKPCETCGCIGGNGMIDRPTWDVSAPNDGKDIPCPDCKDLAVEVEEFVKECRDIITVYTNIENKRTYTIDDEDEIIELFFKSLTHLTAQAKQIEQFEEKIDTLKAAAHGDSAIAIIEQLEEGKKELEEENENRIYMGNSISYIYTKMKCYQKQIGMAGNILRKHNLMGEFDQALQKGGE